MSERKWTEKQLSAIETRDRTLLVSAAAGSGKTATLTERIIRSLLDDASPESICDMLIVTYTNAAVGELRTRIADALRGALRDNPDNERLQKQLLMLPGARIMTIDAFCNEILRENAESVGVSPNYRIADNAEAMLLSSSLMNALISALYDGEMPEVASAEDFDALADSLTDTRSEGALAEFLLEVWSSTQSVTEGISALAPLVEEYNPEHYRGAEHTRYGKYIIKHIKDMAHHYSTCLSEVSERLLAGSGKDPLYGEYFAKISADARALLSYDGYEKMREALASLAFATKPRAAADSPETVEEGIRLRDAFKKDAKAAYTEFLLYSEDEWAVLYTKLYKNTGILYKFLSKFDELYLAEKKRLSMLEFLDVERFAYSCLVRDGERTPYAKALSERFSSIYVDEYQDINELQHRIFEAISRSGNRFMVGDVKQSIYSFRSAAPDLFAKMKSTFPSLENSAAGGEARIFMSNNFRSDSSVIDFANGVFDKYFSLLSESIGYTDEDRLICSKQPPHGEEIHTPRAILIKRPPRRRASAEALESETASLRESEARRVRELVISLIRDGKKDDASPIRAADIAVILRGAKGKAELYASALSDAGIAAEIRDSKGFLLNPEILLTLCLLNSIDNPYRDIYLTGLLASPLFGFTADELVLIRRSGERDAPMLEALRSYAEKVGSEKAKSFLSRLSHYRAIAEGMSVGDLLSRLYRETGLYALAARSGSKRNLTLLYDYAKKYERGSYKGLYSFINYINSVIAENAQFDAASTDTPNDDAVKITTAHSSKGLEYPVVIFAEAETAIRGRAEQTRLFYGEDFGIAMLLRSESGLAIVKNPVVSAINHYKRKLRFEEELRVLYVILTRARERLYLVGGTRDDFEKELREAKIDGAHLSPYSAYGQSSYLDIILTSGAEMEISISSLDETEENAEECKEMLTKTEETEDINQDLVRHLVEKFNYKYPSAHLTRLPEKLSVSRLSPAVLDGGEQSETPMPSDEGRPILPAFIEGRRSDESALRGIATHNFLQFCDLARLAERGASEELSRLVSLGFMSEEAAARVRQSEIEAFCRSELFEMLRKAKRLHRELRFNALLPAALFTENEAAEAALRDEEMLVQGVIDCIIETEDGELILVDYKTDRLTNAELLDEELARKTLCEKHSLQLGYYRLAIEKIFGKAPSRTLIYSLPLAKALDVLPI